MDVFNLQGSINLDTSGFMQGINNAMNAASKAKSNMDTIGDAVSDAQKNIDKAADTMKVFGSNVTALESPFTTLKNKLDVTHEATKAAQEQVDSLTQNFNEYAKTAGAASEDTTTLYEALQKAERQLAQCQAAEQAAQNALDSYNQSVNDSGDSVEEAAQSNNKLASSTEDAKAHFLSFSDVLKANVISDLITSGIGTAITQIEKLNEAVKGLATGFVDSVADLAKFGDQIDKQSQKFNISAKAYQEWSAVLQHSGTDIGSLRMGLRQMRSAMDDLSDYAKGAVVDQEKLTAAQNAYSNATIAAEKAQIDYNASVEKYGEGSDEAYKKALSLEKALNGVETAQSKLSEAQRGTLPSLSAAAAAMQQLSISAVDADGKFRKEEDVFKDVIIALQNVEDETERANLSNAILGRSSLELGALLHGTSEELEEMFTNVNKYGGVLSDDAVKASAKFQDSLQDMNTAISGVSRNLLSNFLPSFSDTMIGIAEIVAEQGDDQKGAKLVESGLNGIAETVETTLPKIFGIIEKVTAQTDKLAPIVFNTVSAITDSISNAIQRLDVGKVIDDALNLVKIGTDPFKNVSKSIVSGIQALVDKAPDVIDTVGTAFATVGSTLWDSMLSAMDVIGTGDTIERIVSSITGFFSDAVVRISQNIEPIATAITGVVPKITTALVSNIDDIVNAANKVAISLLDALTHDNGVLDAVVDMVSSVVDGIVDNIDPILLAVQDASTAVTEKLLEPDVMSKIIHSAAEVFSKIIVGSVKILGSMAGFGVEMSKALGDTLTHIDPKVISDSLTGLGKGILEGFGLDMTLWDEYWDDLGGKVFDKVEEIKNKLSDFVESAKNWGKDLIDNFVSGLAGDDIAKRVEGIASSIADFIGFSEPKKGELSRFHTFAPDMIDLFVSGINANAKKVENALADVFTLPSIDYIDSGSYLDGLSQQRLASSQMQGGMAGNNVNVYYNQSITSPETLSEYRIWRESKRALDTIKMELQM